MPQYKIKVFHEPNNPQSPVSVEDIHAPSPQIAIETYAAIGQKAEILQEVPSVQPEGITPNNSNRIPPSSNNQMIPTTPNPCIPSSTSPSSRTPICFTDNNIKYKIEDGIVYKKDWKLIEDITEYKIQFNQKEIKDNLQIFKLEWVKIK